MVNTDRFESRRHATGAEAIDKAVVSAWAADGDSTDPLTDVRGHE